GRGRRRVPAPGRWRGGGRRRGARGGRPRAAGRAASPHAPGAHAVQGAAPGRLRRRAADQPDGQGPAPGGGDTAPGVLSVLVPPRALTVGRAGYPASVPPNTCHASNDLATRLSTM